MSLTKPVLFELLTKVVLFGGSYLLALLQAKVDFQHTTIPGDIPGQINFR